MSKISYTEKQIEAANILRSIGEDGVSSDVLDEIVDMVGEAERKQTSLPPQEDTETLIKLKLLDETDWKKRAILAARLISKSLE